MCIPGITGRQPDTQNGAPLFVADLQNADGSLIISGLFRAAARFRRCHS
jgi:hypothetical protein